MNCALRVKRGSVFAVACRWLQPDGVTPRELGEVTSSVRRTSDTLVSALTVTVDDAEDGRFTVLVDASGWPVADLRWDFRNSIDGEIHFTETVNIVCVRDETRDGDDE